MSVLCRFFGVGALSFNRTRSGLWRVRRRACASVCRFGERLRHKTTAERPRRPDGERLAENRQIRRAFPPPPPPPPRPLPAPRPDPTRSAAAYATSAAIALPPRDAPDDDGDVLDPISVAAAGSDTRLRKTRVHRYRYRRTVEYVTHIGTGLRADRRTSSFRFLRRKFVDFERPVRAGLIFTGALVSVTSRGSPRKPIDIFVVPTRWTFADTKRRAGRRCNRHPVTPGRLPRRCGTDARVRVRLAIVSKPDFSELRQIYRQNGTHIVVIKKYVFVHKYTYTAAATTVSNSDFITTDL